jgi:NDP-sugar pyrophosphorylase family protein
MRLVRNQLTEIEDSVTHTVILAGGKGERLRPHTEDRPKPMVLLMGNPMLSYLIRWLVSHNFKRITICCGHLHQVIVNYFEDGAKFQADIDYLIEEEPLGRGGALRRALNHVKDKTKSILAMNGDIMTNLNLLELDSYHKTEGGLATLVSVPMISPYGIVDISEAGVVTGFREKPELPFWINAGIYMLQPEIVSLLPEKGDHELLTFPALAKEGKLKAFQTRGFWRSIDTVKDLTALQQECEQLFFGALFSSQKS